MRIISAIGLRGSPSALVVGGAREVLQIYFTTIGGERGEGRTRLCVHTFISIKMCARIYILLILKYYINVRGGIDDSSSLDRSPRACRTPSEQQFTIYLRSFLFKH